MRIVLMMFLSIIQLGLAQSKLKIEPIFTEFSEIQVIDSLTDVKSYKDIRVALTPKLEPEIEVLDLTPTKIRYQLKGNIASGGLGIFNVKKIRVQDSIENDTLILKHYVEVVRVAGKESNSIIGYNYSKINLRAIDKNIKAICIELHKEQKVFKDINQPQVLQTKLLAQTTFMVSKQ